MIPRKFIFLDSFPMNTNGKADRKQLAEKLG
jgi:acyl-CoA synthetase (AMP-forming)/AMP-acid ligase II